MTITEADLDAASKEYDGFPVVLALDAPDGSVTIRSVSQSQALLTRLRYARLDQTRAS